MLLRVRGIAKIYGERTLFKGVDCALDAGDIALLLGPNGAGKSTLLRIIAGLARPSAGAVECAVPPERLAYVGHATFLYGGLTAWENLAFWWSARGGAAHAPDSPNTPDTADTMDARITAALRRVGLLPHAHEKAGIFSRGMAQRLNLARALMGEPQLILLDEPGTGLDAASLALLRREVAAAATRGAGVLWISHDRTGDTPLATHVWELHQGRLHVAPAHAPGSSPDAAAMGPTAGGTP